MIQKEFKTAVKKEIKKKNYKFDINYNLKFLIFINKIWKFLIKLQIQLKKEI